jgi:hypothetical protein
MSASNEDYLYTEAKIILTGELAPEGVLERAFTAEIAGAVNRLHRLAELPSPASEAPETARARTHAQNSLRRCMAELRKLHTERAIRELIDAELPLLADSRQVLAAVRLRARMNAEAATENQIPDPDRNPAAFDALPVQASRPLPPPPPENSFCKTANEPETSEPKTPRNAPCPCRSGQKFKRCCGKNAPPVLSPGLKEAA